MLQRKNQRDLQECVLMYKPIYVDTWDWKRTALFKQYGEPHSCNDVKFNDQHFKKTGIEYAWEKNK